MIKKTILKTFAKEENNLIPIWLMRQAGRYLPEYRKVRENCDSFLDLCFTPELAAEVTLQPIKRFSFDAAIIFSDILVIPYALGRKVSFVQNEGPLLEGLQSSNEIEKLDLLAVTEKLAPVYDAIRITKANLPQSCALIGFAGAPWTVATYMVEGKGSKDFSITKKFAYTEENFFQALIDILIEATANHLINQIEAGAEILQLFDSWSGVLNENNFRKWVIAPTKQIVSKVKNKYPNIPIIGFPRGASFYYKAYVEETNVDAVSLDAMLPFSFINAELKGKIIMQGNLDPVFLLGEQKILRQELFTILQNLSNGDYIFNLGHGILPNTPIDNVYFLVDSIRGYQKNE